MATKEWLDNGAVKDYKVAAAQAYMMGEAQGVGKFGGHMGLLYWKVRLEDYKPLVIVAGSKQPAAGDVLNLAICIEKGDRGEFHKGFTPDQYEKEKGSGNRGGFGGGGGNPKAAIVGNIYAAAITKGMTKVEAREWCEDAFKTAGL